MHLAFRAAQRSKSQSNSVETCSGENQNVEGEQGSEDIA